MAAPGVATQEKDKSPRLNAVVTKSMSGNNNVVNRETEFINQAALVVKSSSATRTISNPELIPNNNNNNSGGSGKQVSQQQLLLGSTSLPSNSTLSPKQQYGLLDKTASSDNLKAFTNNNNNNNTNNSSSSALSPVKSSGNQQVPPFAPDQEQHNKVINVDINAVLRSLVAQGILEDRPGTTRKSYVFRHAMMKTACEGLLRQESKEELHEIVGQYYEDRQSAGDDLPNWHMILADHFFLANNQAKAYKYLELAGEGAVQNHSAEKVYSCYSRLLKLMANATEVEVPALKKAHWCRKVGEALFYMERSTEAEDYLHRALEILSLDCREAPAMTGAEAGFFPRRRMANCLWLMNKDHDYLERSDEFVHLERRPSRLTQFVRSSILRKEGSEYMDEFETFVHFEEDEEANLAQQRTSTRASNGALTTAAGGSAKGEWLSQSLLSSRNNNNNNQNGPPTYELGQSSGRSNMSGMSSSKNSLNNNLTRETSSAGTSKVKKPALTMTEAQTPLRPRLLLGLQSFKSLKEVVTTSSGKKRCEAVDILLEAAVVYDLLGRMLRDRSSSVALERRLNSILLAEAAAISFAPPKKAFFKSSSSFRRQMEHNANFEQSDTDYLTGKNMESDQSKNMSMASGSFMEGHTIPQAQQRAMDELSRAYSRAAVFFAGMHPATRWRGLGRYYSKKAHSFLKNKAVFKGDLAQHSENRVLLHQRCGEYDAIQGNFVDARIYLQKAVWGARFMHLDRVRIETQILELTVFFFNGDLDSCNTVACELFEKNSKPQNVCLGARFMALCGDYDVALSRLKSLTKTKSLGDDLASLEKGLESLNNANAWLTLSFIACRGSNRNNRLALKCAVNASETLLSSELSDAALITFHAVALCFSAIWDPLRDGDANLVGTQKDKQVIEELLRRLVFVIRSYAIVYKVCRPHALYCLGLRDAIMAKLGLERIVITIPLMPKKKTSSVHQQDPIMEDSGGCLPVLNKSKVNKNADLPALNPTSKYNERFVESARLASELQAHWVQGLALLEIPDVEAWREAFYLFSSHARTGYEMLRCEQMLIKAGVKFTEEGEDAPEESAPHMNTT